jgi:hypothetical protein
MFGRIASQVMSYAAVAGVLIEIPIVSNYAFWFMVGAFFLWFVTVRPRRGFLTMLRIALLLVAILAVFVEIPIVSNYAFWIMAADYVITVATPRGVREP